MSDVFVSKTEAARILSISPATLDAWARKRKGPPFVRVGGKLRRYSLETLKRYMDLHVEGGERIKEAA